MEHSLCLLLNPMSPQNGGAPGPEEAGLEQGSRTIQPHQPLGADPLVLHAY